MKSALSLRNSIPVGLRIRETKRVFRNPNSGKIAAKPTEKLLLV
jgi:hypothetical protein